jgi:hypothetical protein
MKPRWDLGSVSISSLIALGSRLTNPSSKPPNRFITSARPWILDLGPEIAGLCLTRRRALSTARLNPWINLGFVWMNWSVVGTASKLTYKKSDLAGFLTPQRP